MLPKIVHQTWRTRNIPQEWRAWHQTWKVCFPSPEFQHIIWTDKDARRLIETKYTWFLDIYDGYPHQIQRADAVRYFILFEYGGIYADLDYECLRPFYNF